MHQSECESFNKALEEYKVMPMGTCRQKAKFAELKYSVCNKAEGGVCCRNSYSCLQAYYHLKRLGLNECAKDEFLCEDGDTCIPWQKICDGHVDCPIHEHGEGGDEEEACTAWDLPGTYHPPNLKSESISDEDGPTNLPTHQGMF